MSPIGTKLTSRSDGAKSAFGGKPEGICSAGDLPGLTRSRLRRPLSRNSELLDKRAAAADHHPTPAAVRTHHQLGFGSGGYTGTAGTKPFRFGISTFGRVFSSRTALSWMMPFR